MLPSIRGLVYALMAGSVASAAWADEPPEANAVVHGPKANQVGFAPGATGAFSITAEDVSVGEGFAICNAEGKEVLRGTLPASPIDDTASSGEKVYKAEFAVPASPGVYRIILGGQESLPFTVGRDPYRPLYRDAARAFYLIRSGVALEDGETGFGHKASHVTDAKVDLPGQPAEGRDLAGGWYNAGDFGKWTHMVAISSSYMMQLHELRGPVVSGINLGIPESGNSTPDLLDQARWGLTWLLKMQNADGSVLHKVDSGSNFCFGKPPEEDPYERKASGVSSIDAGDFVGVMLQASRVYAKEDAAFARRCRAAADRAWAWLQANPEVLHNDPFYVDKDASQERMWALCERACATHSAGDVDDLRKAMQRQQLEALGWQAPEILGYVAVACDAQMDAGVRELARKAIVETADRILTKGEASGYGVALTEKEYFWGSLEYVLHQGACLVYAGELTQEQGQDLRYRKGAQRQLDYALGRNCLGLSLVTGYGARGVSKPHHWTHAAYGRALPGWAAGGPNRFEYGADPMLRKLQMAGNPPAKCFVDDHAWACNEGQTTENAALLFVTGSLLEK